MADDRQPIDGSPEPNPTAASARSQTQHSDGYLEQLAQNSWQLELLVSGFVLFLLAGSYEGLVWLRVHANYLAENLGYEPLFTLPVLLLAGSWLFLFVNLLLHVILRGLWIASVGLSSVSGDIEYDKLKFDPKFDDYLRRKMGTFDRYIDRLEKLSSIFFAFTFLMVFMLISFLMTIGILIGLLVLVATIFGKENLGAIMLIGVPIILAYFLAASIYFIDFVTLGWFKRQRDFFRVYLPIYRFFGFISFAPLYRPLYYNMIDNKFGRKLGYLLVPYFILMTAIALSGFQAHSYFHTDALEDNSQEREYLKHYDDRREALTLVPDMSIPSKVVEHGFLEVFVKYLSRRDDEIIEFRDSTLVSTKWTGYVPVDFQNNGEKDSSPADMLQALRGVSRLRINDSLMLEPLSVRYFVHPNEQERGLLYTLDVDFLPRGEHQLTLEKLRFPRGTSKRDTVEWRTVEYLPFLITE